MPDDFRAERREVERLRQALWSIAGLAGEDLDGQDTPAALTSDIVDFAMDPVREMREAQEAESRKVERLTEALQIALDLAERAHSGNPRTGEDYYTHRDAARAALAEIERKT